MVEFIVIKLWLYNNSLGVIGAITGVISLVWHIKDNIARIKIQNFDCEYYKYEEDDYTDCYLRLNSLLKNKSNKPTSIEEAYLIIDNSKISDHNTKFSVILPIIVEQNSSYKLNLDYSISKKEYDLVSDNNDHKIILHIKTTHKDIKKKLKNYKIRKLE